MHHSTQTRVQTRSLATVLGMHCTVLFTLLLAQAIVDPASFARAAKLSLLQLSEVPQEDLNGLIAELGVATLQLRNLHADAVLIRARVSGQLRLRHGSGLSSYDIKAPRPGSHDRTTIGALRRVRRESHAIRL